MPKQLVNQTVRPFTSLTTVLSCVRDNFTTRAAVTKTAVTQHFLDYVRDVGLPIAVKFLQNVPLPNPIAKGDDASFSWSVGPVKLSGVDLGAAVTLEAPSTVKLSITDLKIKFDAHAKAREDVWPHPKGV